MVLLYVSKKYDTYILYIDDAAVQNDFKEKPRETLTTALAGDSLFG